MVREYTEAAEVIAAFIFDTQAQPHKWHAAIMWTCCAFGGLVIVVETDGSRYTFG